MTKFESAEIYMSLAATRLHRDADARTAAQKVVAAERVERRYASLTLPAAVRTEFETTMVKLLTPEQIATLHAPPSTRTVQTQPMPQPQTVPAQPPSVAAVPRPAPAQPQPQPQPAPPPKTAEITAPVVVSPPRTAPAPVPSPSPAPAPPTTTRPTPTLADADRAVASGDLVNARALYNAILNSPQANHDTLLRVAEGLYRSRDFAGAVKAFERMGPLRAGEEQYHYYFSVALYETGRYSAAKRELKTALPYIEVTPDVARYQVKIDRAAD